MADRPRPGRARARLTPWCSGDDRGLGEHYETLREVTQAMAAFDCLASLATVAAQATYCRPEVVASDTPLIDVVDGRHPMVEAVLRTPYVPNDTHMDGAGRRVLIVTGPNMGGKSSYIRQVRENARGARTPG